MKFSFRWCCRRSDGSTSEPGDVNVQHGGLAVIQRGETAIDGGSEIIRLSDAFAMRAESPRYRWLGEMPSPWRSITLHQRFDILRPS